MYTYVCILYVYIIYKRTTLERTTLKRTTLKRTTLEIHNVYNQYTIYIICKVLAPKPLIQLKHAVALSFLGRPSILSGGIIEGVLQGAPLKFPVLMYS